MTDANVTASPTGNNVSPSTQPQDPASEDIKARVRNFKCSTQFDDTIDWDIFLQRFELDLELQELTGNTELIKQARRNLLLKWIGPKVYKLLVDHFAPTCVTAVSYDDIVTFLNSWFTPARHYLTERLKFRHTRRAQRQSVAQFVNALRAASTHCKFGPTLEDQLRDQFLFGLEDSGMQEIILRQHPEGSDSFEAIIKTALVVETAKNQRQSLHDFAPPSSIHDTGEEVHKVSYKRAPRTGTKQMPLPKSPQPATPTTVHLDPEKQCLRCGRRKHTTQRCPARTSTCKACRKIGHWDSVCVKSGRATISASQRVCNLLDDVTTDDVADTLVTPDIAHIAFINTQEGRYYITITVNNVPLNFEYDTAASRTVIGQQIWEQIGSPKLLSATPLIAYPNFRIPLLGEATVQARYHDISKPLRLTVIKGNGSSLMGRDWIKAFSLEPSTHKDQQPIARVAVNTSDLSVLLSKFPECFHPDGKPINNYQVKLRLIEDARPIIHKPRPVPFALRAAADQEINRLLSENIIEPVDPVETPIEWASPVVYVPKPNGTVRLCGDFKVSINKYLVADPHPLPRFEDVMATLSGSSFFSIIDLKDAYLQLEVAPECRKYLVVATHKGYYRYARLPFGLSTAPALFQRYMDTLLQGLDGVTWFLDDICVGGATPEAHLENLRKTFARLQQANIKTQQSKVKLMLPEITYLGYRINREGIHPTTESVEALKKLPAPSNVHELRSFLGSLNFFARFIPGLQQRCAPLHLLLQKNRHWEWTEEDETLFERLKASISSEDVLVHYNPHLPLILSTDASEKGLGAILLHRFPDGTERPIAVASRTLSAAEKNYSSLDREALAIVFGVHKFYQFLYGTRFTLRSDHKPLERILGNKSEIPKLASSRLTRWAILLSTFDYTLEHVAGKANQPADTLSRLPLPSSQASDLETTAALESNQIQAIYMDEMALTRASLKKATQDDSLLRKVQRHIDQGWPPNKRDLAPELFSFFEKREELSFEEGTLLWRNRIIIPQVLKSRVLTYLHQGHPGIVASRELAKLTVWWPQIEKDLENLVATCSSCQQNRPGEPVTVLNPWNPPGGPWERLHVDLCGLFEGVYWVVVIDAYSRWCEVVSFRTCPSAQDVIRVIRALFARYGVCALLVTDNGPQFTAADFTKFCAANGAKHIRSTPYHARTNGIVERVIQTLKFKYIASKKDYPIPEQRLQTILYNYRTTPHSSTGRTPADLFLKFRPKSLLDRLKPNASRNMEEAAVKQKLHHDRQATSKDFEVGSPVWAQRKSGGEWKPGIVAAKTGPCSYQIMMEEHDARQRFHADQLRVRRVLPDRQAPET